MLCDGQAEKGSARYSNELEGRKVNAGELCGVQAEEMPTIALRAAVGGGGTSTRSCEAVGITINAVVCVYGTTRGYGLAWLWHSCVDRALECCEYMSSFFFRFFF